MIDLIDRLFDSTPVGIAVWDLQYRFLRVNPTLAAMNGLPAEAHIGRPVEEVIPDLSGVADALRTVAATGDAVTADVSGRTPADPETEHHWAASYYPVRDDEGRLIAIGAAVLDVTAQRRGESALRRSQDEDRFLVEASRLLASSLDMHATLESIADLAVPTMADWCSVDLLDEHGTARNVALAHADPDQLAIGRTLPPFADDHAESPPPVVRVIQSGRYALHATADEKLLREASRTPEEEATWRALRLRSVMIVPMAARGRTIGAISFGTSGSGRTFDEADVAFAERLAGHCGLAVDNARLFAERTDAARQLQENLLPPGLPDLPGFELAARYRAAGSGSDVGGDFYDVFPIGANAWLLAIGDVQGKGPRAAAVTGLARYTIRAAATRGGDAADVLTALNDALLREEGGRRFLTLVYATLQLDGAAPSIRLANAGHPRPFVVRAGGAAEPVGDHGLLLGVAPDLGLAETSVDLQPGDAFVLYTDGVIEARVPDGEQLGEEGLARVLERCVGCGADEIAGRITSEVLGEQGVARDDVAILVLRRL